MKGAEYSVAWARHLFAGFIAGGGRHVVIAPGSRSTPLVLAALSFHGLTRHVLPDERSAAFFALGLARATGSPAILVTTSGTAAANAFPAVIEASEARVPLIVLTADRPPEAHACRTNQTIDQTRLFGTFARGAFSIDVHEGLSLRAATSLGLQAADLAGWPLPGPVQVNLGFREPLVPESDPGPVAIPDAGFTHPRCLPDAGTLEFLHDRITGRPGLLVAGATPFDREARQALLELSEALRAPLLADPLSGLRFGLPDTAPVCAHQDLWLRDSAFREGRMPEPEWVLAFGDPPVSKTVNAWLDHLAARGVPVMRVHHMGDWPDPGRRSDWLIRAETAPLAVGLLANNPAPGADRLFSALCRKDRETAARLENPSEELPLEARILRHLVQHLPDHGQIFFGNSLVIRQADSFLGLNGKHLHAHANRGASGIDGNVSTVSGLAAAHPSRTTVGLLGDLTFWHDRNGLHTAHDQRAILVVFDNGGGGIFDYLPQAGLPREDYERFWRTPTGIDPVAEAALQGLPAHRVGDLAGFEAALDAALADARTHVIVVTIDPEGSRVRHLNAGWKQDSMKPGRHG